MNASVKIKAAFLVVYVCVAAVGACYLAAAFYFLLNKTIPDVIELDTWYRYWQLYGSTGLQGGRLFKSAAAALAVVYIGPLFLIAGALRNKRSLHGDARWATVAEMRKAGLL